MTQHAHSHADASKTHDSETESTAHAKAVAASASEWFSWAALLKFLMSFGNNAPAAAELFLEGVELIQQGFEKFLALAKLLGINPAVPAPSPPVALSVTDEEEARAQCIALAMRSTGPRIAKLGDGKLWRGIGDFLKANPWVWQLLMGMIKGAVPAAHTTVNTAVEQPAAG